MKHFHLLLGCKHVPDNETHRYGIIDPLTAEGRRYQVRNFVEKPATRNSSF